MQGSRFCYIIMGAHHSATAGPPPSEKESLVIGNSYSVLSLRVMPPRTVHIGEHLFTNVCSAKALADLNSY